MRLLVNHIQNKIFFNIIRYTNARFASNVNLKFRFGTPHA